MALEMGLNQESQGSGDSNVKLPFKMITSFMQTFTHLNNIFNEQFSAQFTRRVKQIIQTRVENMSERDVKYIEKDEISSLIQQLQSFLEISDDPNDVNEFTEQHTLTVALRFLKSENLEKRLKGLNDIRLMCDRVIERQNFEKWAQATGKDINMWNRLEKNKEKPYPSNAFDLAKMKQWLTRNNVMQIIFGPTAHIEIIKRCSELLGLLCRAPDVQFDE